MSPSNVGRFLPARKKRKGTRRPRQQMDDGRPRSLYTGLRRPQIAQPQILQVSVHSGLGPCVGGVQRDAMQLRAATIHEYSSIRTRTRSYCFTWPGPRWFGGRKPAIRSAFAVFLARAAISARELSSQVEIALSTHLLCFGDSSCPLTVSMGSSLRQASKGSLTERSLGSQEDWPITLSGSCTYREWKPCKKNGQTKPECAGRSAFRSECRKDADCEQGSSTSDVR